VIALAAAVRHFLSVFDYSMFEKLLLGYQLSMNQFACGLQD
jgi:hypothetical protein